MPSPSNENLSEVKELLSNAGQGYSIRQMTFGINGKPVLVEYTEEVPPLAENLLRALSMVHSHTLGRWITTSDGKAAEADSPYPEVPKICISRAFEISASNFQEVASNLCFLYVVQGLSAARLKVVYTSNAEVAATGMMHEAMNGYNIALSGAMHRELAPILLGRSSPLDHRFIHVRTWREVVDEGEKAIASLLSKDEPIIKVLQHGVVGTIQACICC